MPGTAAKRNKPIYKVLDTLFTSAPDANKLATSEVIQLVVKAIKEHAVTSGILSKEEKEVLKEHISNNTIESAVTECHKYFVKRSYHLNGMPTAKNNSKTDKDQFKQDLQDLVENALPKEKEAAKGKRKRSEKVPVTPAASSSKEPAAKKRRHSAPAAPATPSAPSASSAPTAPQFLQQESLLQQTVASHQGTPAELIDKLADLQRFFLQTVQVVATIKE